MKDQIRARTLYEMKRSQLTRMDLLVERLEASPEFWALIKGYAGLTLPDLDHDGKIQGRDEFLADLQAEIAHQSERLDEDLEEANAIGRDGGDA